MDKLDDWLPIETVRRGTKVEGLTYSGKIIVGRIPAPDGKIRDVNTVTDKDGFRHVCTHWRPRS